jgi:hypothetical protein
VLGSGGLELQDKRASSSYLGNVGERMAKFFILTRTSKKRSYTSAARLSTNSTSAWLCSSHLSTTIQKIRQTTTEQSLKADSRPLR